MDDLKNFIYKILDIINYTDDRKEFSDKILLSIYSNAIEKLLNNLPSDKQGEIKNKLNAATTQEEVKQIVEKEFDSSLLESSLRSSSQRVFLDYFESIDPIISEAQKDQLNQYFSSVSSGKTPINSSK